MTKIKAKPNEMLNIAKNMDNNMDSYEKTYEKLVSIIEKNEARLDKKTQNEFLKSYEQIHSKYVEMSNFLRNAIDTTEDVAKSLKRSSENADNRFRSAIK